MPRPATHHPPTHPPPSPPPPTPTLQREWLEVQQALEDGRQQLPLNMFEHFYVVVRAASPQYPIIAHPGLVAHFFHVVVRAAAEQHPAISSLCTVAYNIIPYVQHD